jgi:molybdopterin-containing oxidoreductase family membrane subunit
MWFKKIAFGLIFLSLAAGAWGFFTLLTRGTESVNLSSIVPWGLWMSVYVFFASMAAGLFFIASLDLLFKVKAFVGTGKIFMLASFASLSAGLVHVLANEGRPERFWHVFLYPNFESVLTWSVWIYTAIALATAILLIVFIIPDHRLAGRKETVIRSLMIIGFPIAVAAAGATGFTLSTQSSHAFWNVGLFPVLFPIFGLSAGLGLSRILLALFGDKNNPGYPRLAKVMAISTIILLLSILYIIGSVLFVGAYVATPATIAAANYIMFGPYWYGFWIIQIGLGVLVPLIILTKILLQPALSKKPVWAFTVGVLLILGAAVARLNFIIPAQVVVRSDIDATPFFPMERLVAAYVPSLSEWTLSAGITALFVLLFYVTALKMRLIPIIPGNKEEAA